ncbi:GCN5 family acetyltransferase [Sphingomonas sp. Leaf357]|uniref:GNAT family N-acetyltransferase n=1 Tax=Sphingomonas sp. Leaf357 TaxID=1736350 RepID=UPI0006FCA8F4|nr:N-acetyltransferase [Sphingomonas sp. Leaf357]KQS04434.1 GCN5 family acetyltransferase [Sphingomonas sp. Leaf357]
MVQFVPIAEISADAVEQLLDRAFGTDRHGRTAYRIREGAVALPDLSFAAIEEDTLIGTIQCWPIALCGDDGRDVPLIMLGPVAVEPLRQQGGIGRLLTARALEAVDADPASPAVMLIGDPEYYGRFFGFVADRTGGWRVPGPVERRRLLARGTHAPLGDGLLGPRVVAHV